ncbi:MAG: hypothetical protein QW598_07390 [Pyrobaculum sp.]
MDARYIVLLVLLGIAIAAQAQTYVYELTHEKEVEGINAKDLEKLLVFNYKDVKIGTPGMMASPVTPQGTTIELRYNRVMAIFSFDESYFNSTLHMEKRLVILDNISDYRSDIGIVYGLHVFVVDSRPPFSKRLVNKRQGNVIYENVFYMDVNGTGRSISLSVYYFTGYRYDPNGTVVSHLGNVTRRYVRELCIYWWETTASLWRLYGYNFYPYGKECRPATRSPTNITVLAINRGVEVWVDGQKFYFLNLSKPLYDYLQASENLSRILPGQYLNIIVLPDFFGDSPHVDAKVLSLSASFRGKPVRGTFFAIESEESALEHLRFLGLNFTIVSRRQVRINGTLTSGGFDTTWFYTGPYIVKLFYITTSYSGITSTIPIKVDRDATPFLFATAIFIGNETVSIPRYFYNFGGALGYEFPFLAANSYFYKNIIVSTESNKTMLLNYYMIKIEPYGFKVAGRSEGVPRLFELGGDFEVKLLDRGTVVILPEGTFLPFRCEVGEVVTGGRVSPYYFINFSNSLGFVRGDIVGGTFGHKRVDGVIVGGDGWVGCSHYVVRVVLPNGTVVRLVAANGTLLTYTPPSPVYLPNNTRFVSPVELRINVTRPVQIRASYAGREYLVRFMTPLGVVDKWLPLGAVASYDGADVNLGNGTRIVVNPVRVNVTGPVVLFPSYTVYYFVRVVLPWGDSYGWEPRGSDFSFVPSSFVDLRNGTALRQPNGTCSFVVVSPRTCTIVYSQRLYYVEVESPGWRYANWTLSGGVIEVPALIDLGNRTRLVDPEPSRVVADRPKRVVVGFKRQYYVALDGVTKWEGWVYEGGRVRVNKTTINGVEYVPKEEYVIVRGAESLRPIYTARFSGEFRDALGLPNNWARVTICGKVFQADLTGRVEASVDTDGVCDISIDKPLLGMYSVVILVVVLLLVALFVLKFVRKK